MTARLPVVDYSTMIESAKELQKKIDEFLENTGWSKRKLAQQAGVPYSWLVDLERNQPLKLDVRRARQVIEVMDRHTAEPVTDMSETEAALLDALQCVIAAVCTRGNPEENLRKFFSAQKKLYVRRSQSDAEGVMDQLLGFLQRGLPRKDSQATGKSAQPAAGQSET